MFRSLERVVVNSGGWEAVEDKYYPATSFTTRWKLHNFFYFFFPLLLTAIVIGERESLKQTANVVVGDTDLEVVSCVRYPQRTHGDVVWFNESMRRWINPSS